MNDEYVVEPCMIGDSATMEDAEYIAAYLTSHGHPARAAATEGHRNSPDIEPPSRLWSAACDACAVAHKWA